MPKQQPPRQPTNPPPIATSLSATDLVTTLGGPPPQLVVDERGAAGLRRRHPWVFAGGISLKRGPKNLPPGTVVDLVDSKGRFLARGSYNDNSQIAVRVLTFREQETVDGEFIRRRLAQAVAARQQLLAAGETDSCRLVFAEADLLPGLIVDRYGDWLVVQFLAAGLEAWRGTVLSALAELLAPRGIFERSDAADRRQHEGLSERVGVAWGEEPPETIIATEHGVRYAVDVRAGHKTGFYLDQRENRLAVARHAAGRRVLNAFAYTGGFGLQADRHGAAAVCHVDSSQPALDQCAANLALNELDSAKHELHRANVFDALAEYRRAGRQFDLVVLDPPKFAASRKNLPTAERGYQDLNHAALRLLPPGGLLASFSCSGAVDAGRFREILARAAAAAGRHLQIIAELGQPSDHPVLVTFPEGSYLNGVIARTVD